MTMRKLVGLLAALLAAGCGRDDRPVAVRPSATRRASAPFVAPRDTVVLNGVYRRDGDEARIQLCGVSRTFRVVAADSLLNLLDANVDWHAPRPSTTMYVEVGGDTIPEGHDSVHAGTLAIVAVDKMRGLDADECAPKPRPRPEMPPPYPPAAVTAVLRAALGADSGLATPANYRSVTVWLDSDTLGDLLVLLRAPAVCELAGCTLFIFHGTVDGYQLIGRTGSVVAPIQVRQWPNPDAPNGVQQEATEGKLDLQVKVNGGAFGLRDAILRYRNGRYPRNASLEPPPGGRRGNAAANGTTVLR
jgi:hypothetical protein